jgi:hypothetical protein
MFIGYSAARRRVIQRLLSGCLLAGTNLSCLGFRWTSVVMLGWESMERVLCGESSHGGSIKTTRDGFSVAIDQARACTTTVLF